MLCGAPQAHKANLISKTQRNKREVPANTIGKEKKMMVPDLELLSEVTFKRNLISIEKDKDRKKLKEVDGARKL